MENFLAVLFILELYFMFIQLQKFWSPIDNCIPLFWTLMRKSVRSLYDKNCKVDPFIFAQVKQKRK